LKCRRQSWAEGFACRAGLNPRLGEIARCGHARRSIEMAIKPFGCAPWGDPGPSARASDAHRDAWPVIRACSLHRPHNGTLQLPGA
jgi:hypothetical protein